MPFLEIAFQAEVSRFEDEDFKELAQRNCWEDPNTRDKFIEELRSIIKDRRDFIPRRLDNAYLLKFLRTRRFKPHLAYQLMVRYEDFRRKNAELYNCDPFSLWKFKNIYSGVVPDNPVNGRTVILNAKGWVPGTVTVTDVNRVALVMIEILLQQPKIQILGFTIIIDVGYLSLWHMRYLNTTFASQMAGMLGLALPIMVHRVHIVNYSRLISPIIYLFKQFMPTSVWNRICFHGTDVKSLHRHIDPEFLPLEYGGTCRTIVTFEEWILKINIYKDDVLVRELRDLGYTVK